MVVSSGSGFFRRGGNFQTPIECTDLIDTTLENEVFWDENSRRTGATGGSDGFGTSGGYYFIVFLRLIINFLPNSIKCGK